jgi:hypothetical protein
VPYQLLSALAGTLIEAEERNAAVAVLVVHVFTSAKTKPDKVEENRALFEEFVNRIGKSTTKSLADGTLYGPFSVPGAAGTRIPANIPVLLGELTSECGQAD